MTRMTAAFPVFVVASALTLAPAPVAQADPIQATYTTAGTIGTTGITGTPGRLVPGRQRRQPDDRSTIQPRTVRRDAADRWRNDDLRHDAVPDHVNRDKCEWRSECSRVRRRSRWTGCSQRISLVVRTFWEPVSALLGIPSIDAPPLNWLTHWITEGGVIAYGLHPTQGLLSLAPIGQNGGVFEVQAQLDAYSASRALNHGDVPGSGDGADHEDTDLVRRRRSILDGVAPEPGR